jgi:hypothetical protein
LLAQALNKPAAYWRIFDQECGRTITISFLHFDDFLLEGLERKAAADDFKDEKNLPAFEQYDTCRIIARFDLTIRRTPGAISRLFRAKPRA